MLNIESVDRISNMVFADGFRPPDYGGFCFSGIPGTILEALGVNSSLERLPRSVLPFPGKRYNKVAILILDGFGWKAFERYRQGGVLDQLHQRGVASMLTSQFPSTTAAHITTIFSGQPVYETGVFEWFYYEDKLKQVVQPLPFQILENGELQSGASKQVVPESFVPERLFNKALIDSGKEVHMIQNKQYFTSPYNRFYARDVTSHLTTSFSESLDQLESLLVSDTHMKNGYAYCYYDGFDVTCHQYGAGTPEADKEAQSIMEALKRILSFRCEDTLFILTADHGSTLMNPDTCIYLLDKMPELETLVRKSACGHPLAPVGSARDYFLYLSEEHIDAVMISLRDILEGSALVFTTDELIEEGIFGPISDRFRNNLGQIVILPFAGASIYWSRDYPQRFIGHHGGLTPEEMDTMFIATEL